MFSQLLSQIEYQNIFWQLHFMNDYHQLIIKIDK